MSLPSLKIAHQDRVDQPAVVLLDGCVALTLPGDRLAAWSALKRQGKLLPVEKAILYAMRKSLISWSGESA
jgi:hypothetical protein